MEIADKKDEINKRSLHVEVRINPACPHPLDTMRKHWQDFLTSYAQPIRLLASGGRRLIDVSTLPPELQKWTMQASVETNQQNEDGHRMSVLPSVTGSNILVHVFVLSDEEVCTEELEATGGDDEWATACDSLQLPHQSLDGLWENLIFANHTKTSLLEYSQSALLFSDRAVSSHIIHWNRILLLHGPPGTGKTSLCRALAHKLAIRLKQRYESATLLEINSHALFSKWFSTSGKLVSALFQMVRDMTQEDPSNFVCVLIDEVESLASSRNSNQGSGDPSDAMRAVNSLLTSLDKLRVFPNVLVLATTNLTGTVDSAFVDRVDLKLFIGMPVLAARYHILSSCLEELQRVNIIDCGELEASYFMDLPSKELPMEGSPTSMLLECAKRAEGLSGRSLRKLPLQAHAQSMMGAVSTPVCDFLSALLIAIQQEQSSRAQMTE